MPIQEAQAGTIRIEIGGVGIVEVPASFLDLSPEEQEATINEIHQQHAGGSQQQEEPSRRGRNRGRQDRTPKEDDGEAYVGQTVGGIAGGVAGAAAGAGIGAWAAPFTFGLSIPIGAVIGGALGAAVGGAGGEAAEHAISNVFDGDEKTAWNNLTEAQKADIIEAGVEEGIFGLVPGVGGGIGKGARVLIKSGRGETKQFLMDKVKALVKNKAFRAATGKTGSVGVGQVASDVTGKAFDAAVETFAPGKLASMFAKLSNKDKKAIMDPLIEDFLKSIPGRARVKSRLRNDLTRYAYGSQESLERLFKEMGNTEQGLKAIRSWAKRDIVRKAAIGSAATAVKGGAKAATDIFYSEDGSGYATGGEVSGGLLGGAKASANDLFKRRVDDFIRVIGRPPFSIEELDENIPKEGLVEPEGDWLSGLLASGKEIPEGFKGPLELDLGHPKWTPIRPIRKESPGVVGKGLLGRRKRAPRTT